MQTQNLPPDQTTATAPGTPPDSTKQICADAPEPVPGSSLAPEPDVDPELLGLADDVAAKIREYQAQALGCQIMAAAFLRDSRDLLSPSDWKQILRSRRLGAPRTVQRLVRVAGQKAFRDSNRLVQLPDSLSALSELAGLPVHALEQALNDGTIGPTTTLKQVKQFVQEHSRHARAKATSSTNP